MACPTGPRVGERIGGPEEWLARLVLEAASVSEDRRMACHRCPVNLRHCASFSIPVTLALHVPDVVPNCYSSA